MNTFWFQSFAKYHCFILLVTAWSTPSYDFWEKKPTTNLLRVTPMMQQLIHESENKEMLMCSKTLETKQVPQQDVPAFLDHISKHSDYRSYHLLFALRRDHRDIYNKIPVSICATILSSTLEKIDCLNDWGDLRLEPEDYLDYEPVKALLDIGKPAVPYLLPLLEDNTPATLEGSEEATDSYEAKYRRADWACRFISLILKFPYRFSEDPEERDMGIAALKRKLERQKRKSQ